MPFYFQSISPFKINFNLLSVHLLLIFSLEHVKVLQYVYFAFVADFGD